MTHSPAPADLSLDEEAALDLVMELIAVPGRSGSEERISAQITQKLLDAGVPESRISSDRAWRHSRCGGSTGNLIVKLPGTYRAPRRLLMAHMDTVPLCVGSQPVRKGDFIRSRNPETALGGDNRAGASVVLNAALHVLRHELPHPPLTLLFPIEEEVGLTGARHVSFSRLGNPKLSFNWDGGLPHAATIGATGDYNMVITVHGLASHAGVSPEAGISAIAIAGRAIADLTENGWHGLVRKGKKEGTSNIGMVEGGQATNVVTPLVRLEAEVRSHDPKFRMKMRDEFRKAFERASRSLKSADGRTGSVEFEADLKYESFRLDPQEPTVQTALAAVQAAGLQPETRISNGGLDANWMSARGLPTVTLGVGQQYPHTVEESLHVPSFLAACRIGLILATGAEAAAAD